MTSPPAIFVLIAIPVAAIYVFVRTRTTHFACPTCGRAFKLSYAQYLIAEVFLYRRSGGRRMAGPVARSCYRLESASGALSLPTSVTEAPPTPPQTPPLQSSVPQQSQSNEQLPPDGWQHCAPFRHR